MNHTLEPEEIKRAAACRQFFEQLFGESLGDNRKLTIFTKPNQASPRFTSIEEAAEYATTRPSSSSVYHGLGTVDNPSGRGTADEVLSISALWCDIDCQSEAHQFDNLPRTIDEAVSLLAEMPLPPSIVVDSGNGIHGYWLLSEPWIIADEADRAAAKRLAKGWHGLVCQLGEGHGWDLDNLGDLARVLRTPGTVNPKGGKLVSILANSGARYERAEFERHLPRPAERPTERSASPAPQYATGRGPDLLDRVRRYLDKVPGAVEGQAGGTQTLLACKALFRFGLDDAAARQMFEHYNAKCSPPWTDERQISHKLSDAKKSVIAAGEFGVLLQQTEEAVAVDLSRMLSEAGSSQPDKAAPPKVFRGVSVGDIAKRGPSPMREYVIGDLLRRGEIGNLIAPPKVGKSWLVMSLALRVAAGGKWLDRFECARRPVAIVDNELHLETIENRVATVSERMGLDLGEIGDGLQMWPMRGEGITYESMRQLLDYWKSNDYKPALVILDASYRFLGPNDDENSNADTTRNYNLLDAYANEFNCSFILIHHASKGVQANKAITDIGAGAGAQSRAADCHIVLVEHEHPNTFVLRAAVRSSRTPEDLAIRRDEFGLWTAEPAVDISRIVGSPEAAEKRKIDMEAMRRELKHAERVDTLRKWLARNPGDHLKSQMEACGMPSPKANLQSAIDTLVSTGELVTIEGKDGKERNRTLYRFTEKPAGGEKATAEDCPVEVGSGPFFRGAA